MLVTTTTVAAILLYLGATLFHITQRLRSPASTAPTVLMAAGGIALALHGYVASELVFSGAGVNFSLWPASVLILFVVNLIVLLSSLRKPLHSLLILLFPASALGLTLSLALGTDLPHKDHLSLQIGVHVLFSLLAYSVFTVAAAHALLLAYQDRRLKQHHPGGFLRGLPPLQTMEALLFEYIWAGIILLTLSLITGFLFLENLWAQHLAHKSFFSVVAWLVFATLLWGRYRIGWRSRTAIRWTLGGFISLALAYWGSKFVLEVLLGVPA
ncbi:MAG: phosphohydrolase [Porticoccaceae bacterium]|nr:phosphohydrolase [Porticoccaceae bacterium]